MVKKWRWYTKFLDLGFKEGGIEEIKEDEARAVSSGL